MYFLLLGESAHSSEGISHKKGSSLQSMQFKFYGVKIIISKIKRKKIKKERMKERKKAKKEKKRKEKHRNTHKIKIN